VIKLDESKNLKELRNPSGTTIYNMINANKELEDLELKGFLRGDKEGKTFDVSFFAVKDTLDRQVKQLERVFIKYLRKSENVDELKRCIADVRNCAGAFFLKILEETTK